MKSPYPDRYFIALSVPDGLKRQLQAISGHDLPAKWNRDKDYHITLRYLDLLEGSTIEEVHERLSSIRKQQFSVEVRGLHYFDNPKQNILWAKVESTRKLTALAGDINEKLMPLGFEMPNKPYIPHVTMARVKASLPIKTLQNYMKKHEKSVMFQWTAMDFHFMRSTRRGQVESGVPKDYDILYSYQLTKF